MEIYLGANATTRVIAQARQAALAALAEGYGNPSSLHSTGLRAGSLLDGVRARARRVLAAPNGRLLFVSGATQGIQTAVVSALASVLGGGLDAAGFAAAKADLDLDRDLGLTGYRTLACGARVATLAPQVAQDLATAHLQALLHGHPDLLFADVREAYEQRLGHASALTAPFVRHQANALSQLLQALPDWLSLPALTPVAETAHGLWSTGLREARKLPLEAGYHTPLERLHSLAGELSVRELGIARCMKCALARLSSVGRTAAQVNQAVCIVTGQPTAV